MILTKLTPAALGLPVFILLLLLLLTALGLLIWQALRKHRRHRECQPGPALRSRKTTTLSPEGENQLLQTCFRGLSYALANETDKAVAEFVKIASVDTTTAEIYLALGQLFRISGEFERALRVHRDILLRPSLPETIRRQTFFEIGLDYKKAGLLERASKTFSEILEREPDNRSARIELAEICISLREWEKALELYRSFPDRQAEKHVIAHLTTEIAKLKAATGEHKAALKIFRQALEEDEKCIDAWLHYGDSLLETGKTKIAFEAWEQAFELAPELVGLVIKRLRKLPEEIRKTAEIDFFDRHLEDYGQTLKFKLAYIDHLIEQEELDAAGLQLRKIMLASSGDAEVFTLVRKLLEKIRQVQGEQSPLYLELIQDFFSTQLRFEKPYQCRKCGYQLDLMVWRCPRCNRWDTITVR